MRTYCRRHSSGPAKKNNKFPHRRIDPMQSQYLNGLLNRSTFQYFHLLGSIKVSTPTESLYEKQQNLSVLEFFLPEIQC